MAGLAWHARQTGLDGRRRRLAGDDSFETQIVVMASGALTPGSGHGIVVMRLRAAEKQADLGTQESRCRHHQQHPPSLLTYYLKVHQQQLRIERPEFSVPDSAADVHVDDRQAHESVDMDAAAYRRGPAMCSVLTSSAMSSHKQLHCNAFNSNW